MIKRTFFLLMLVGLAQSIWAQTYVTVHLNNGVSHEYALEASGKIDLATEGVVVIRESNLSGVSASFYTDDIRKITFSRNTADIETATRGMNVYPNPTTGPIVLQGWTQESETVRLYSVTGQLMETYPMTADGTLDISRQSRGVYILSAGNSRVKIVKL